MNRTNHSSYGSAKPDSEKSPEVLQHEVDAARERLGVRLDTLSHRLSPGELLDQALSTVKEHGGEFSHNLGSQVKQNPLPMILTGVGLSWLMMGTRSPQPYGQSYTVGSRPSAGDRASGAADAAKSAMHSAAGRTRDMKERAGEMSHSLHERAGDMNRSLHQGVDSMAERAHSAQQQLEAFCRDQPVLAGSLGIAFGALLGSMLPHTRQEDALIGDVSEEVKSRAMAAGSEQYDKAREKGRELAESAKEQVQRSASGENSPAGEGKMASGSAQQGSGTSDYTARGSASPSEQRKKDEGESHQVQE